jgi:hypothetical protein
VPTSEDYRQMANRAAQIAIACSAPSVAGALLALALEYMALADGLSRQVVEKERQLQEMQQDPAGFGDWFLLAAGRYPVPKYAPQTGRMLA